MAEQPPVVVVSLLPPWTAASSITHCAKGPNRPPGPSLVSGDAYANPAAVILFGPVFPAHRRPINLFRYTEIIFADATTSLPLTSCCSKR
jgi:hypothetical protein